MKLLIVDDEQMQRMSLKHIIESAGLPIDNVETASDAVTAKKAIDDSAPEIVLSDICMPVVDGLELAHYLHEHYPDTVVILITGYSRFEYAHGGIEAHVFDYILKPIERDQVIASVRRACREYEKNQEH